MGDHLAQKRLVGSVRVAEGREERAQELIAMNLSVDLMKVFGTLESSTCSQSAPLLASKMNRRHSGQVPDS